MRSTLIAGLIAFLVATFLTPAAIRVLRRYGIGQEIREEGPQSHQAKRGTPTMGGLMIILATVLGYLGGHLSVLRSVGRGPTASALLLMGLFVALGMVGLADDYVKVRHQRSLGLNGRAKLLLQLLIAVAFALLAVRFPNRYHLTPAATHVSFLRDLEWWPLGTVGFVVFAYLIITAASNAVNLTDGLDGLATGASVIVLIAYTAIAFWAYRHGCWRHMANQPRCYDVRDGLDLALLSLSAAGACFGFLWWNGPPARIFMGDTGSLALGGLLAGLAILTRTELLLVFVGGLFVVITLSVIIQVAAFRLTGRRVFRMAPLQHHFELAGWAETTIVVRFWIIAGCGVAAGLGIYYADFLYGT